MALGWDEVFHVVNPSAAHCEAVARFFDDQRWPRVWIERTSHPTHLETVMSWAVNEGRKALAIWGGDGTFSRAINALADLDALDKVRLALVPAGTCNDFARQLRLLPWERLVRQSSLVERSFDLGLLEHAEGRRLFVNNAGFGRRPEARRTKRPNAVLDIFRLSARQIRIETVDRERIDRMEMRALLGIVFNAPYFGGGLHFSPDIAPDDGRLEGYFLAEQPRWRVLVSFVRGRSGRPFTNAGTVSVAGSGIHIRSTDDLFPQVDGERASDGGVRELIFTVLPRALTMLVPK